MELQFNSHSHFIPFLTHKENKKKMENLLNYKTKVYIAQHLKLSVNSNIFCVEKLEYNMKVGR